MKKETARLTLMGTVVVGAMLIFGSVVAMHGGRGGKSGRSGSGVRSHSGGRGGSAFTATNEYAAPSAFVPATPPTSAADIYPYEPDIANDDDNDSDDDVALIDKDQAGVPPKYLKKGVQHMTAKQRQQMRQHMKPSRASAGSPYTLDDPLHPIAAPIRSPGVTMAINAALEAYEEEAANQKDQHSQTKTQLKGVQNSRNWAIGTLGTPLAGILIFAAKLYFDPQC